MTSGTLRTILIVGLAVGAVSVAACKVTTTTNTADNSAMTPDNSMMSNASMSSNTAMGPSNAAVNASATAPMMSNSTSGSMSGGNSTAP
jgi:hypothetical protein